MKYPTLAEFNAADLAQCKIWASSLPTPQTDTERTIHRRLTVRVNVPMPPTAGEVFAGVKKIFDEALRKL